MRERTEYETIPVLFQKIADEDYGTGTLKDEKEYIEAEVEFICADKLVVACECFEE